MGATPSTNRAPNINPARNGTVRREARISGKIKKAKIAAKKLPTTTAASTQPDMATQEAGSHANWARISTGSVHERRPALE
jgi:hypothetical protein